MLRSSGLVVSLLAVLMFLPIAVPAHAQDSHINLGLNVFGGKQFENKPWVLVHGETAEFGGWSDGYAESDGEKPTFFVVDILDPNDEMILHERIETDGQGNAYFTMPISEDLPFGLYEVLFTLEKEGEEPVTPNLPNVSYFPSRFFVTWTQDEIVDVSGQYEMEVQAPDGRLEFGSMISFEGTLCPSPLEGIPDHGFFEPVSEDTVLDERGPYVIFNAVMAPLDEDGQAIRQKSRSVTWLIENPCGAFEVPAGFMTESGTWSVTTTAQWFQKDDPTHVYQVQGDEFTFEVGGTIYRTDEVARIVLDSQYQYAEPMDWSSDGEKILFRHGSDVNELAIFTIDTDQVVNLGRAVEGEEGQILYAARFSPDGRSVYLHNGGGVYRHSLETGDVVKLANIEGSFDVIADGRIVYMSDGKLMVAGADGGNPQVFADLNVYSFDVSDDGKKVVYRKVHDAGYGWANSVIAYYDIEARQEHEIPGTRIGCGETPRWAPNSYHIAYHEQGCGRGWPGGILYMTDVNGSFVEFLVPTSNNNPRHFMFGPDGNSILIAGSFGESTLDDQEESANFYIMTLARPVPEFGSSLAILTAVILIACGVVATRSGLQKGYANWK